MRVTVTGGAGFIGSHLVEVLLKRGDRVCILDDFNSYYEPKTKRQNAEKLRKIGGLFHSPLTVVEADIRSQEARHVAFHEFQPEVVFHLAARVGVRDSIAKSLEYASVNTSGTMEVACAAACCKARILVFTSSSAVYGNGKYGLPADEHTFELCPLSPYAASKMGAEAFLRSHAEITGQSVKIARLFTVYGPRMRPDLAIHKFARLMMNGEDVPQYGNGHSKRDYTYIDDVVEGLLKMANLDGDYEVFNLGGGNPVLLRDMISILSRRLGVTPTVKERPEMVGDAHSTCADATKAANRMRWSVSVPFEEGIDRFAKWFLQERESAETTEG